MHANESSLWKPGLEDRAMEQNWKKYHIHFYILLSNYFHSPSGMLNLGWSKVVNFMFLHFKFGILIYRLKKMGCTQFSSCRYLLRILFLFLSPRQRCLGKKKRRMCSMETSNFLL